MSIYVVTFPLKTEPWIERELAEMLESERKVQNRVIAKSIEAYENAVSSDEFLSANETVKSEYEKFKSEFEEKNGRLPTEEERKKRKKTKAEKEAFKVKNKIFKDAGITEFGLISIAYSSYKDLNYILPSSVIGNIGKRVYRAWDKKLYGNGQDIHFKKYGQVNTLQNKCNDSGIRFMPNYSASNFQGEKDVVLISRKYNTKHKKIAIPIVIDKNNMYETLCFNDTVKYCTIVRRSFEDKDKYFVQITFEGTPPVKMKKNGEFVRKIGKGTVGVDIGIRTVACVSKEKTEMYELAPGCDVNFEEIKELERKIEHLRRVNNPDNYNEDGTNKAGSLRWHNSKHYKKLVAKKRYLNNRYAIRRKIEHETLANNILSMGNDFNIEKMDFKSLQNRKTDTETSSDGFQKSKKNFGKVIADRGPALFLTILQRKADLLGGIINFIPVEKAKASQYSHTKDEYIEKKLSQRFDKTVDCQRDLYSVFLLMCYDLGSETLDKNKIRACFDDFKCKHDTCMSELVKQGKISPDGVWRVSENERTYIDALIQKARLSKEEYLKKHKIIQFTSNKNSPLPAA